MRAFQKQVALSADSILPWPSAPLSRVSCPGSPAVCPNSPLTASAPHLLGDASGRLRRWQNLFPDPIQRRGLPVRDLHSHGRHRLQGEVAAGSSSQPQARGPRARAQRAALSLPALAPRSCCGSLPEGTRDHRGGQVQGVWAWWGLCPPTGYEQ